MNECFLKYTGPNMGQTESTWSQKLEYYNTQKCCRAVPCLQLAILKTCTVIPNMRLCSSARRRSLPATDVDPELAVDRWDPEC